MFEGLSEKLRSLKSVVTSIEKQFGKGAIMALGDESTDEPVHVIPTGSLALDSALGVGGYPRGRIVEIYGPESSGKTTLTLHAIREAQRGGGVAAFIDAEHAFDATYARAIGVDTGAAARLVSPTAASRRSRSSRCSRAPARSTLVVVDSVAALTPKAEIEGEMGDSHMGLQARLMSQALRKLTAVAAKTETTIIFINQLRQKIGVVFGNPETTTGGNALKFYASVRVDVRRASTLKSAKIRWAIAPAPRSSRTRWRRRSRRPSSTSAGARASTARPTCSIRPWSSASWRRAARTCRSQGEHLGNGRERARDAIVQKNTLAGAISAAVVAAQPRLGRRLEAAAAA
jgi:recombination protein RecA